MRRSAAPSQAGRPRFIAPHKQPTQLKVPDREVGKENAAQNIVLKRLFSNTSKEPNEKEEKTEESTVDKGEHVCVAPPIKKTRFESPMVKKSTTVAPLQPNTSHSAGDGHEKKDEVQVNYYSVVWCKRSSKKHKKWEGDAILVTKGRTVTLYDTEGKEIGKGTGYKSTELASLKEDETLPIGGKEIQVMSLLSEDQFKSGKCFTGGGSADVQSATKYTPVRGPNPASNQFCKPKKTGSLCDSTVDVELDLMQQVKPRHDPEAPGALVLTRPSPTHQWMWNKKNLPVVDVVVDPYLSYHLRPHQREGVNFLYECVMGYRNFGGCGAILADDMGLGKTLQCISLVWTLLKQGPYGGKAIARRILIVTPGSLVKNWFLEFKKWLGLERIKVYAVGADKKVEDFLKSSVYPVLIISYEMFVRTYELVKQVKFDLIVCDEGHRLKNAAIKTTSLLMTLPTQRRAVLTGTPIQNDLQEFYSIVEFCNPGVLGTSASFRRVYEEPIVASRQPGAKSQEVSLGEERGAELSRMTQMFVLRRTQEINNKYLPPKSDIVVFCKPSPLQVTLYHQLLRCQLIQSCLSGHVGGGAPHLICIGALKKLCNHPSLVYHKNSMNDHEDGEKNKLDMKSPYAGLQSLFPDGYKEDEDLEEHSGKLFVLSQLLQQLHNTSVSEKIVVVSNHTKTLDLIQCMCGAQGYSYLRLDGQTPTARRQELVQKFNSSYCQEFIFLLSSKAGGVGLNLIGASRLVLYDIDWNPANDLQAMARVWRDGQKRKVHIYRFLTTGTIEEKIFQRQISKQGLSGAVMDVGEKHDVQFSLDDLKDLFSVNLNTDCDTHDLLNCDCFQTSQLEQVPAQMPIDRPCQLGVPKKTQKSKNIGMDELMDWKHYPASVIKNHQEWYLEGAWDKISFVFYSDVHGGS